MELPSKTLLALLKADWTLTDEGIKVADIAWMRTDWHLEKSTFSPHIICRPLSARRLQAEEPNLYEFRLAVQVVLWAKSIDTQEAKEEDHWKMVEHVKKLIEAGTCPTGWQYMYVENFANPSILEVLPNIFIYNLTVVACISWSGI
jgi:hypothetical protein